jgi:hypothetical protein
MRKIRIPMSLLEESHNPKRVEEDRSIAIEAAIVRIMKVRSCVRCGVVMCGVYSGLRQTSYFFCLALVVGGVQFHFCQHRSLHLCFSTVRAYVCLPSVLLT